MKCKFLIFGGTTEGRLLADIMKRNDIPHTVSVATRYGQEIEEVAGEDNILVGRMTCDEMAENIKKDDFTHVVDATHPFAVKVSSEIRKACEATDTPYLRLLRNIGENGAACDGIIYVDDLKSAAAEIKKVNGPALVLTGSRDIEELAGYIDDVTNLYVRILPDEESLKKCKAAGLTGKQIIAMQGPFSVNMNKALIDEVGAKVIFTKDSGKTGGFAEKIEAANLSGIKAIVLSNPEGGESSFDKAFDMKGILLKISELAGKDICSEDKRITLAGIGPGNEDFFTKELESALDRSDVIFGAKTVTERLLEHSAVKALVKEIYKADEIIDFLGESDYCEPLVVFSGDISFYSGAKKAEAAFREKGYKVSKINGISSIALFANRLSISLEDVKIISSHGKNCNVKGFVRQNEKVILLVSNCSEANDICKRLTKYARVVAGYELGTEDEEVFDVTDEHLIDESLCGKCILYIENNNAAKTPVFPCLSDDEFIRDEVPMTKEEIRAFSLRKLALYKRAVLYDVGAGTGSVSVEAALSSPDIEVFSIEKKHEAADLVRRNAEKFGASNIHVIEGSALEVMGDLPVPTHVFIGGSGRDMAAIIDCVRAKNPEVRIVINCVTPETFGEVMDIIREKEISEASIVQLQAARFEMKGSYHLPKMQSPVYVITL